jgi:hypothetical protein
MITNPRRGGMKWIPSTVLDEINNIKQQDQIKRDAEAFDRLLGYAKAGREINHSSIKLFGLPIVKKQKNGR